MNKIILLTVMVILCISVVFAIPMPPTPEITSGNITLMPKHKPLSIELVNDWSLISLPIMPNNVSINAVMGDCDYNRIWRFDKGGWTSTDTGLIDFELTQGYWVDRIGLSESCTITIKGREAISTSIDLVPGWNLVGFPSTTEQKIEDFIDKNLYNMIWEYQLFGWINLDTGLDSMKPGHGYWIYSENAGSYVVEKEPNFIPWIIIIVIIVVAGLIVKYIKRKKKK